MTGNLKNIVSVAILVIFLGVLYQYQDILRARFASIITKTAVVLGIEKAPCEEPILYTLSSFDSRFGISKKYFLSALAEAEMIWEKPFGRELFAYREGSGNDMLNINLVYDYRQQATDKLSELGTVVEDNKASYEELRVKFIKLKTEFANVKNDYDERVQHFNAAQKAYEEQVKYWNGKGGAPNEEYAKLQAERADLQNEADDLQVLQAKVNDMADEVNALVVVLNRLAKTLNITVEKYNTTGASRGETFEEGIYFSDGRNKEIDIYEFSSRTKLVRVLAHEFGHALDLGHVSDPKAIMYELNQGNSGALTETDLNALKAKCEAE